MPVREGDTVPAGAGGEERGDDTGDMHSTELPPSYSGPQGQGACLVTLRLLITTMTMIITPKPVVCFTTTRHCPQCWTMSGNLILSPL